MPPKGKKTVARRPKLPFRRREVESSTSPSPPATRKRRAATTKEARERKLQRETPTGYASKRVTVTKKTQSSSSSSLGDPMASTTPPQSPDTTDNSSPLTERNVYDKIERMANRGEHDEALPHGVHVFGEEQTAVEQEEREEHEEQGEREQTDTAKSQEHGRNVIESEEEEQNQSMETTYEAPSASKKKKQQVVPRKGIRDLPVTYFRNEESKSQFYQGFHSRPVHIPRPIDFDFLEEHKFDFETVITMQNWKHFLRRMDPVYYELVLLLHWNWDFKTFSSTVKGIKITLGSTMEEAEERLGKILKIPHQEDTELPTTATLFNTLSRSAKYSEGHSVMKTNELSIPNRVLRQFLRYYLLPKQGGTDTITIMEAQLIWKLSLMKQISIPKLMLQSLAHLRSRSNLLVPYGMWWTRVFKRYKVDLTKEPYTEMSLHERDFFGATMLRRMHINAAAYKAEMEAKEQADLAAEENQPAAEGSRGGGLHSVEPGSEAQNASPRWYPGSWNDRIQGGDSWIPWDGARSNYPTQASARSHHIPSHQPDPQPDPQSAPQPAPQTQPSSQPTTNLPEQTVSNRSLLITISAIQSSISSQFNALHAVLARVESRLDTLSERQAALETNQLTFSAQLASLTPNLHTASTAPSSSPPVPPS